MAKILIKGERGWCRWHVWRTIPLRFRVMRRVTPARSQKRIGQWIRHLPMEEVLFVLARGCSRLEQVTVMRTVTLGLRPLPRSEVDDVV
jgi:hypothetical protein